MYIELRGARGLQPSPARAKGLARTVLGGRLSRSLSAWGLASANPENWASPGFVRLCLVWLWVEVL